MESNFGTELGSGDNDVMQACTSDSPCSTLIGALITGCQVLQEKLEAENTYPLATSYYNCGEAYENGQPVASCQGTVISPYGAATIFLAFKQAFSGTLSNGYRGFTPTGDGTTASVMETAVKNPTCNSPGTLCNNTDFAFGGGCVEISEMT